MKEIINKLGASGTPFLFILDYELKNPLVLPLHEINANNIKYKINKKQNYQTKNVCNKVNIHPHTINKETYKLAFDKVIHEQQIGNNYLLNLTFSTPISTNSSLEEIFHLANAKYKLLYNDTFVCFSPETFIKIINGEIFSYPMKGTIDASLPNAKKILLSNHKENQEHTTIVDLIRNDLSQVATNISVTKFKYLDKLKTSNKQLLQMSSEIKGTLPKNYQKILGDILYKLLPAGSITGAPKVKCIELINNIESHTRGYYTGVMGIFDGNNLDSAVMIRFIEKQQNDYYYKSGGGIRIDSDMDSEFEELNDKIYIPIH
ncbi:MAG: aminodeoxychorismate synthase component I [Candidatus Margulisbacteria bacterium]|nr:aminodeoxychorismate synthase component I [Candidatus Margulisiibacteriota bacterium]